MLMRAFANMKKISRTTISVEGNIGAGKSTFLKYLKALNEEIEIIQEPVSLWKNCRGFNVLDLLYKDPARYGVPFQALALVSLLNQQTSKQSYISQLHELHEKWLQKGDGSHNGIPILTFNCDVPWDVLKNSYMDRYDEIVNPISMESS